MENFEFFTTFRASRKLSYTSINSFLSVTLLSLAFSQKMSYRFRFMYYPLYRAPRRVIANTKILFGNKMPNLVLTVWSEIRNFVSEKRQRFFYEAQNNFVTISSCHPPFKNVETKFRLSVCKI